MQEQTQTSTQEAFAVNLIDLGEVEGGREYSLHYQYLGNKNIVKVTPGCGCTSAEFTEKTVSLVYTAGRLDNYYINQGLKSMPGGKNAKVHFDDDSVEMVTFSFTLVP